MTLTHLAGRLGATALLATVISACGGGAATPAPVPTGEPAPAATATAQPEPAATPEATPAASLAPSPAGSLAPAGALVVEASEFKYVPSELTIPSSGSTTIELVNAGVVEHDFTIDALTFQIAAPIGESVTGTLTDPPAGTYEVYCTVPGHKAAGMVGTLLIEG